MGIWTNYALILQWILTHHLQQFFHEGLQRFQKLYHINLGRQ